MYLIKKINQIKTGLITGGGSLVNDIYKYKISKPKVSIITVVYNDENNIEKTIQSVLNQKFNDFEYIIIDGGSKDNTKNIIKKYENKISLWLSDKDDSLYHAMNRGLLISRGEWVNYMNSGDYFYDDLVLSRVFKSKHCVDVIYGNTSYRFDDDHQRAIVIKPKKLSRFWMGMPFVHQSCFISASLMKKYPFSSEFKLAADYNSIYKIYLKNYRFMYLDIIISSFLGGGLSDNNTKTIIECRKIVNPNNKLIINIYFYYRFLECQVKNTLLKLIGRNFYNKLRIYKSFLK